MNYDRLYKRAKKIIGNKTPLYKDCGFLCGKACCRGDENTGMLLFPFEKTSLTVKEKNGIRLAVCEGSCDRGERPLACMLFPFFPYITQDGRVRAVPDIRGRNICPIARNAKNIRMDRGFLIRVKKVGRLLCSDEKCRAFLCDISREADMLSAFTEKMSKI